MSLMHRRSSNISHSTCSYAILRVWLLLPAVWAQTELPIDGTVTMTDGQPLAGVFVYGSNLVLLPHQDSR